MRALLGRVFRGRSTLPVVVVILAFLAIVVVYSWQLGSLPKGLTQAEVITRGSNESLPNVMEQPLNAPYRLLQFGLLSIGNGDFYLRLSSAIFALFFIGLFYLITKLWFGRVLGLFASLIFASTPWLIILGRSGLEDIALLTPLTVVAAYMWLVRTKHRYLAWFILFVALALTLYTPGGIWLVVFGLALTFKSLLKSAGELSLWVMMGYLLFFGFLLYPLGRAIFYDPTIFKLLALIPPGDWSSLLDILKAAAWNVLAIGWRTPEHLFFNIGRLPLLNAVQIVLLLFGIFAMWTRARRQTYLLLTITLASILIAAINQDIRLLILSLPPLSVLIAAGLRYLYVEWRNIFPRNPFPKALALGLMSVLVLLNLVYGVRYSLVAWPNTLDTRRTHMLE